MLINFCNPALKPVISCSGACHDGYNVTNLVSANEAERQNGFLGYGSPPTVITIQFLSHVNIKHIVIGPQVLSKKSLGLEIFAKCPKRNQLQQPPANSVDVIEDVFEKVGFINLQEKDKGVIFYKNNHKPNTKIEPEFINKSLFNHYTVGNTNCIRIRIFKAISSVPALGRVEVWGEPGRSCSRSFKNHIYKLWYQNGSNITVSPEENIQEGIPRHIILPVLPPRAPPTNVFNSLPEFQIPEEFLDAITCEVMALPFILPSGKVVDLQSLEKHKEYEALYGRGPSDPFTGIKFTQANHPVADHGLRRRIVTFITENSHKAEFYGIPRTTGNGTKTRGQTERMKAIIMPRENAEYKVKNSSHERYLLHQSNEGQMLGANTPSAYFSENRPLLLSDSISGLHSKRKLETNPESFEQNKKCKEKFTIASSLLWNSQGESIQKDSIAKSYEKLLKDRLDSAVKSALAGLPSFVKDDSKKSSEKPQLTCNICKSTEMLYMLPCDHQLCRMCLISKFGKKIKPQLMHCIDCKSGFKPCDAQRYHDK